jgi:hypothetical protein
LPKSTATIRLGWGRESILPAIKKYAGLKGVRNTNLAWWPECQWQFAPVDYYGWVQSKSGSIQIQNKSFGFNCILKWFNLRLGTSTVSLRCTLKQPEPNLIALRTKMHKHKKQQPKKKHTHTHKEKEFLSVREKVHWDESHYKKSRKWEKVTPWLTYLLF